MKRRDVLKAIPATTAFPVVLAGATSIPQAAVGQSATAESTIGRDPAAAETFGIPDYAQHMLTSDMEGLGPDGKPTGQKTTFTGASKANATAEQAAQHQMTLTEEEQAILDGKQGQEKAKLMKILVAFGKAFGAEKLGSIGLPDIRMTRSSPSRSWIASHWAWLRWSFQRMAGRMTSPAASSGTMPCI